MFPQFWIEVYRADYGWYRLRGPIAPKDLPMVVQWLREHPFYADVRLAVEQTDVQGKRDSG